MSRSPLRWTFRRWYRSFGRARSDPPYRADVLSHHKRGRSGTGSGRDLHSAGITRAAPTPDGIGATVDALSVVEPAQGPPVATLAGRRGAAPGVLVVVRVPGRRRLLLAVATPLRGGVLVLLRRPPPLLGRRRRVSVLRLLTVAGVVAAGLRLRITRLLLWRGTAVLLGGRRPVSVLRRLAVRVVAALLRLLPGVVAGAVRRRRGPAVRVRVRVVPTRGRLVAARAGRIGRVRVRVLVLGPLGLDDRGRRVTGTRGPLRAADDGGCPAHAVSGRFAAVDAGAARTAGAGR